MTRNPGKPAATHPRAGHAGGGARDPWLDNAKFILIVLVIFGHTIEPLQQHLMPRTAYVFLYTFHIPAFVMLSGAVASSSISTGMLRALLFRLLLPYLGFQLIYAWLVPGTDVDGIATPYWLLWYLPSLIAWRLMLPLFVRLHFGVAMAAALTLALVAGTIDSVGYYLSISRTLVFFPFFLIGYTQLDRWREAASPARIRVLALVALATLALAALEFNSIAPEWLYGSVSYAVLGVSNIMGLAGRTLQLLLATSAALATLALIPRSHSCVSRLGKHSLNAYLLHGVLIKTTVALGGFAVFDWLLPDGVRMSWLLIVAILLAVALCHPWTARLVAPLTRPRWLERRLLPDQAAS